MKDFIGTIVEESLEDNRILNNFEIVSVRISTDEKPEDRWHLYKVKVSRGEIESLASQIKSSWYMHFWQGNNMIAVFKDKFFKFDYLDKSTWKDAVAYGLASGIPEEQLDFIIE